MNRSAKPLLLALLAGPALAIATVAHANEGASQLLFENHQFTPQTMTVAAGQPVQSRLPMRATKRSSSKASSSIARSR